MNKSILSDGIVLLAKRPGITSFYSLNSVKKALGTGKVGHTGTLDSFAQGLLVVCTGRLTKLAGNITEFDKSYEAVIKFGEETDTLEYTGKIIRSAPLPNLDSLTAAINKYTGKIMQSPPAFSALHVNGKRASDLAREGKAVDLPPRPVTVFEAKITETKANASGLIEYCKINFSVSKGTYIRCLARDIGKECGSAAHLICLYRTKVGNFKIEDSAGYNNLNDFTIDSALSQMNRDFSNLKIDDSALQEEILKKKCSFDPETAKLCGFSSVILRDEQAEKKFCNGLPLNSSICQSELKAFSQENILAVFSSAGQFKGLIELQQNNNIKYKFVIQ